MFTDEGLSSSLCGVAAATDTHLQAAVVHLQPSENELTLVELLDPADWPAMTDKVRTELVHRGPCQLTPDYIFPKRADGRGCHHHYFFRKLQNGEKMRRSWLVYSKKSQQSLLLLLQDLLK